jgi:ABC-2 type transport system ATP-binding protein
MLKKMNQIAIEVKGLSKNFARLQALKAINLTINRGEMFGFVGADGAGKSTLIRLLCGVIEPTSGSIKIFGRDLNENRTEVKREIGYFSQRFSLYGDLTVEENIEFFAKIHGVKNFKLRAEELLNFTRLTPFRKRLADKLSGGMKQKLALSCTLIHTPKIIFLDEPTTGVDPVSRRDFWKILSDLLKSGITIVMTTPYLDEAERCGRVGLMDKGELLIVDTPQSIKALLREEVVELVCKPVRKAYELLKDHPQISEIQAFGDRLNIIVRDKSPILADLRNLLSEQGVELTQWRVIPPSLENIFISLLKSR